MDRFLESFDSKFKYRLVSTDDEVLIGDWLAENFAFEKQITSLSWIAFYAVIHNDTVIGGIVIRKCANEARVAEIGMYLPVEHRYRGHGTQIMDDLAEYYVDSSMLSRLQATTSVKNVASVKMLDKSRLEREARLRMYTTHDGILTDAYIFSICADK